MDVGENTTGCDGGAGQQLGELLVVADSELDVAGHNSALLVVLCGVSSELQDLSDHVLQDCSQVDWGTRTNLAGITAVLQESADSANWELKTSL